MKARSLPGWRRLRRIGSLGWMVLLTAIPQVGAQSLSITQVNPDHFPNIVAYVPVLDSEKKWMDGLDKQFEVQEDQEQVKGPLRVEVTKGIDIVLCLDNSGSMKDEDRYQEARSLAIAFFDQLKAGDRVAVIIFGNTVRTVNDFTDDKAQLKMAIKQYGNTTEAKTKLYDAIYKSIDATDTQAGNRKAIFVLTDGKDEESIKTPGDCIEKANKQSVPIYIMRILGFQKGSKSDLVDRKLGDIAEQTGGLNLRNEHEMDNLGIFYREASLQLQQYKITYHSRLRGDGKWHTLQVSVRTDQYPTFSGVKQFKVPIVPASGFPYIWIVIGILILAILIVVIVVLKKRKQEDGGKTQEFNVSPNLPPEPPPELTSLGNTNMNKTGELTITRPNNDSGKTGIWPPTASPGPLAWLMEKTGDRPGGEYRLKEGKTTIGRLGDNDIVIDDQFVSRQHAVVFQQDGDFYIQDMVSTSGTHVNGKKVDQEKLTDGDEVQICKTALVFIEIRDEPKKQKEPRRTGEPKKPEEPQKEAGGSMLTIQLTQGNPEKGTAHKQETFTLLNDEPLCFTAETNVVSVFDVGCEDAYLKHQNQQLMLFRSQADRGERLDDDTVFQLVNRSGETVEISVIIFRA